MGKLRHSEAVNLPQSLQLINSWTKVPPRLSCSKVNVINDHIMLPLPFLAPRQRLLKYWSKSTQLCLSVRRWNHIGWARKYLHEHLFVPSFSQKKPKPKEARWFAHGYTWLWANSGLLCSSQWFCHMTFQAFSPMGYITNSNFYSSFWMIPATCLIMSLCQQVNSWPRFHSTYFFEKHQVSSKLWHLFQREYFLKHYINTKFKPLSS